MSMTQKNVRTQKLRFPGSIGHELGAQLDLPLDGEPLTFALFAHCFTCTKNLKVTYNLSKAMIEHGIAVLRFDFTGLGESSGDFSETSLSSNITDLIAATQFLKENFGPAQILIGHSLGGSAILQAAFDIPECKAIALLATAYQPSHLLTIYQHRLQEIEQDGEVEIHLGGRKFRIRKQFFQDLQARSQHQSIDRLGRPLMVLHSPLDDVVPINEGLKIFQAAAHPKCFISLEGANHLFNREQDAVFAGQMIATWAKRYLTL